MKVGLVAFANKWTGAGAVAELSCRALQGAGVDARLLFVGGRNLERRLHHQDWALPDLVKERRAAHLRANLRAVRRLAESVDVVVCHLPHDHLLCVMAGAHRRTPLVRSFRNPHHIRRDPYHQYLTRRLSAALCPSSAIERALQETAPELPSSVLPVPVEDRFTPADGSVWRDRLGIPFAVPVIGAVGKLARGRGFELLLQAVARIDTRAHVVVVGHGERLPKLQTLAWVLEISDRVHWAGYRDQSLPDLYGSMDIFVFPAPGSDWGHRAVSEAQASGLAVVAVDHPGVEDLVEDGVTGRVVENRPKALATAVDQLLANPETARVLGDAATAAVETRRMEPIGRCMAQILAEGATLGR